MRRLDAHRALIAALVASCCVLAARPTLAQPTLAQPTTTAPDWAFGHPGGEVGLLAGSVLSLSTLLIPQQTSDWAPSSARKHDADWDALSDVTGNLWGSALLGTTHLGLEISHYERFGVERAGLRGLRTSAVDVEAFLLSIGITSALKRLVGRCRPRAWDGERCGPEPEHTAFPSGHVAPVAAIAGTQLTFALRSDGLPAHRFVMFGAAEGFSVATAALRVMAGAHSWEDVLTGWAIGHGAGALVQLAHPMETVGRVPAGPPAPLSSPAMMTWSGTF
jgi:membrane-associated phospholipid phosphatase